MRDYIERLRAKPEHIRRRIALGTSVGITGAVAGVWFLALIFSGNLSLAVPSVAAPTSVLAESSNAQAPNLSGAFASTGSNFSQLLGAVGVATATTAPATLIIEDQTPSTTPVAEQNSMGQTVIPF